MKKLLLFLFSVVSILTFTSCGNRHTHEYKEVIVKAATCTRTGLKKMVCECGDEKDETIIPRRAHIEVKLNGVDATCIENGRTEGKMCLKCNAIIVAQATILTSGHFWDNGVITKNPTFTEEGVMTYTCTRCYESKTEDIEKEGYLGSYPQTKVEANSSNGLSSITFNKSTWTDYGYYIDGNVENYMYYYDVDTDDNGTYDYRGVYFTSYRPVYPTYSSSTSNSFQNYNGYNTNTIYWFKYEPIKWNILETKDGKALILADLILDSQDYNYTSENRIIDGNTVYANNYMYSHIRQWLNDTFYETAFNDLEKAIIETTNVDNSATSTGISYNSCACANTNDKIFLLSNQEANKYFTSDNERTAKTTDYAKCQGVYVDRFSLSGNGHWWLRSPVCYDDDRAYITSKEGYESDYYVNYTSFGVRAACWINL